MTHPICERCQQEIQPGQNVEFVGMSYDELMEQRIIASEDVGPIVHADPKDCAPLRESTDA